MNWCSAAGVTSLLYKAHVSKPLVAKLPEATGKPVLLYGICRAVLLPNNMAGCFCTCGPRHACSSCRGAMCSKSHKPVTAASSYCAPHHHLPQP